MATLLIKASSKSIIPFIASSVISIIFFSLPINFPNWSKLSSSIIVLSISAKSNFFFLFLSDLIKLQSILCEERKLLIQFFVSSFIMVLENTHSYALLELSSLKSIFLPVLASIYPEIESNIKLLILHSFVSVISI